MSNCKKFNELTLMLLAVNINERQGVLPEFINHRLLKVPKQAVKTDAEFILLRSYFVVAVCLTRLSPKTHVKLG